MSETKSICGAFKLLDSIFCFDDLKKKNLYEKFKVPKPFSECRNCGRILNTKCPTTVFCSNKCRHDYYMIPVECSYCGRIFKRYASALLNYPTRVKGRVRTHYYCSKKCQGKWLSDNYGFKKGQKRNPAAGAKINPIVWFIFHLYLKGYKPRHIAGICKLKNNRISQILYKMKRKFYCA